MRRLLALCSAAAALAFAPPAPTAARAGAVAPRLGLVSQSFNVAAAGSLEMVLTLPTAAAAAPDATVVVTAYRAIDSRAAVADALDGTLPRSVDTVDLPVAALPRPAEGQVAVSVPLETDVRTATALQMPSAGLYPVVVEVQGGGDVLAELTTFVHRLPGPDEPALDEMGVVVAMTTSTAVALDDTHEVVVDDAVLAEYTHLAEVLEATLVPVSLRVSPATLAALAAAGPEGAAVVDRIVAALDGPLTHELLSEPGLPLDPSSAAAADAAALYSEWLRAGEDMLAATTDRSARRTATIIAQAVSQDGAALLRDTGSRLLVLPVEVYDVLPDSFGGFTDSTQLVQLSLGNEVTIDAVVVDRTADQTLARATTTPALTAVLAVADLVAAREAIVDAGGDPSRHGLTLATPDLSLPNAATLGAISAVLADTPGLRPTSLDDLGVRTDHLQYEGDDVVVGLPEAAGDDLRGRVALATELRLDTVGTSSMLPTDDPRLDAWNRLLDLIPTQAVDDEQAARIATGMRADLAAVRSAVELPDGFAFNLTGRTSLVRITLRNTGDTPLTVVVRLTSPKLRFPDGDQTVELPAGERAEIKVRIEARTNGKHPVTLEVLTPEGNVRLGNPVPLTARVTALSGLGPFVTGAALLVVLTWWVRHVRQNRRTAAAGTAANRHPAARPTEIDDDGLSPDAATSTLPNS